MRRITDGKVSQAHSVKQGTAGIAGCSGCFRHRAPAAVLPVIAGMVLTACVFLSGCADGGSLQAGNGQLSGKETSPGIAVEAIPEEELQQSAAAEVPAAEETAPAEVTALPEPADVETEPVAEEPAETETAPGPISEQTPEPAAAYAGDWVSRLPAAQDCSQLIVVEAEGSTALLTMHAQTDGVWQEVLSCSARTGRNGIGKTMEGDGKTPQGVYGFLFAFGTAPDPGTAMPYTQADGTYYWVDDSSSAYYNQFVSTASVEPDWQSAENIAAAGSSYRYVLALDYNAARVPGAGSAIFLHCLPTGGAGCIAVPESDMRMILQRIQPGCRIYIDTADRIREYRNGTAGTGGE